jgi:hypothetical protein
MRPILLAFAILFPVLTFGQVVEHFGNPDTKWNVADSYPNGNLQNPYFVETRTTIFGFVGDTLVNGRTWLKMYSTADSLFTSNLNFEGFIRSSTNHILKADANFYIDTLYQFNLSVGDSVNFDFGFYSENIPVIKIDSVLIGSAYYKTLDFAEPTGPNIFTIFKEKWIEGIGSIHGPLFPNRPEVFSTEMPDSLKLVCTESNGDNLYQHPSYSNCIINIILSLSTKDLSLVKVFPNPVQNEIWVSTDSYGDKKVSIRNQLGHLIHCELHDQPKFTIQFSKFKNGFYFMTIEENGEYQTWKLIKNN